MKTPKEKANELYIDFRTELYNLDIDTMGNNCDYFVRNWHDVAKELALKCVKEIVESFSFPKYDGNPEFEINGDEIYWNDVKTEIVKL